MQPDPFGVPGSDPDADVFLEQLKKPLKYLRELRCADDRREGEDQAPDSAAEKAVPSPDLSAAASREPEASLVKKLEDVLGFAPVLDLPSPDGDPRDRPPLSKQRYSVEGELASGGMGRVLLVYDQDIRRRVAMKVVRDDIRDPKALSRFLEEAQATGQLEHPNIAPVYDLGIGESGKVFFTMKLVRGRNLREILRDLAIGRLEIRRHFTLTRLVQILQQVSMGIHYAHVRGVIHRDLKPDNIMVGDFGEVLVLDWGLAKISGRGDENEDPDEAVESSRQDSKILTRDGTIQGTLAYMAPEQARGWIAEIDERTDIFGLGAILYEILTYRPPFEGGSAREILGKAGVGEILPPHLRAPRHRIPPSLEEICTKALSPAKDDRYPDAKAFHEALQVYLDGSAEAQRRSEEASQLTRQGQAKAREYARLGDEEWKLRQRAREELSKLKPHEPAERKAKAWSLADEATQLRQQRIRAFDEATSFLHSAINIDESYPEAREELTKLYWDRFEEAERAGNVDDTIMYRGLVERYHDGKYADRIEGKGLLRLQSDPAGAEVTIHRVVERGRMLVEEGEEQCGKTPSRLELPLGHHLLVLRKEGYRDTRYPLLVERGCRLTAQVNLYRDEEIGKGFIYVPAGEVQLGGDSLAPGALEATCRYVEDIFVAEFPVTFREYCRFLDDLRASQDEHLAEHLPHTEQEGDCVILGPDGRYEPRKDLLEPPTRDRYQEGVDWNLPILAVSWFAASRYAEWLSQKMGRRVRLLGDAEWEKAARGVARSIHPWGDFFDWSFPKGGLSRPEYPQPEPVGAFPIDRSIYGIRDLAGSIREWCADWFIEGTWRLVRAGCWSSLSKGSFRSAMRLGYHPGIRSSAVGFRVAVEPPRRKGK